MKDEPTSGASLPGHERVYRDLRDRVLFGELAPGQAVTIQGLTAATGAGMTPVREAIRRLISDGGLIFRGNRRVSVPELTAADVEELSFVRHSIEPELARRACLRIDGTTIDKLEQIDDALDAAIASGDVEGYLRGNYDFHASLNAHANAPILTELAERVWLRFGPSMRVVCGRVGTLGLPDRHKEILIALRARDADATSAAMLADVVQGMDQIRAEIGRPSGDSIDSK